MHACAWTSPLLARPNPPCRQCLLAGVKTLCNACGVKWYRQAKAARKSRSSSAARSSSMAARARAASVAPRSSPHKRPGTAGESGDDELTTEFSLGLPGGGASGLPPRARRGMCAGPHGASEEDEEEHDAAMSLLSFAGISTSHSKLSAAAAAGTVAGGDVKSAQALEPKPKELMVPPVSDMPTFGGASMGVTGMALKPEQGSGTGVPVPAAVMVSNTVDPGVPAPAMAAAESPLDCLLKLFMPCDVALLQQLRAMVLAARDGAAAADNAVTEASARLAALRAASASAHAHAAAAEAALRVEAERLLAGTGGLKAAVFGAAQQRASGCSGPVSAVAGAVVPTAIGAHNATPSISE